MNKIEKVLLDNSRTMHGSVLGFGSLDEKLLSEIDKNQNITTFTVLSDLNYTGGEGKKRGPSKKISYRKIRKKFRKQNIQYIIASYDDLHGYHRRFISDSLYLAEYSVILFVKNEDIDIDIIKKRYARYHQKCDVISCRDGVVFKITKKDYKENRIRDTFYLFINFVSDGINFIGDLFVV